MAVRPVLEIGHPMLAEVAPAVDPVAIGTPEVQQYIEDIIDSMRAANGSGLAANQIGIRARIFAAEVNDNPRYPYKPPIPLTVIINPVLEPLSERTFDNYEGCLSVPNLRGVVERHLELKITGYDRCGKPLSMELRGYSAGTFQHEADHLDGMLFPHKVKDPKSFCTWGIFKAFHEAPFKAMVEALVAEFGA